jgi:hypothetical protein
MSGEDHSYQLLAIGTAAFGLSFQNYSGINSYGPIRIGKYGIKVEFLYLGILFDKL